MSDDIRTFGQGLRALIDGISSGDAERGSGRGGVFGGGAGQSGGPPVEGSAQFPVGGIDFIKHDLRVVMSSDKAGVSDTLVMTGAMTIQRTDPYIGESKLRQIDFKVLSWAAVGWSERFNAAVTYVLSEDVDQPVSTIVAEQATYDFPASFNFKVIFDARINNEVAFRRLEGRPEGHGFRQVPPTGERSMSPTITRFADIGQVKVTHPQFGDLVVKPIDCNDRQGETLRETPGAQLIRPLGFRAGGTP